MSPAPRVAISGAVEGVVDEAVLRRLVQEAGADVAVVHGTRGKQHLHRHVRGYNNAARFEPWLLIVDLNDAYSCAADLRNQWLPNPERLMAFRVAVREVEAWLLGDRPGIARFLGVSVDRVPLAPEELTDLKNAMVVLARASASGDSRGHGAA